MMNTKNVAVIGGGLAGCAAAYELERRGCQVTLFEKEAFIGGRAHTWRRDGIVLDTGASYIAPYYSRTWEYVDTLGLRKDIITISDDRFMMHERREYLLSNTPMALLRYPFLRWRDKARLVAWIGWLLTRWRRLDIADPASLAAVDNGNIADYARSLLGEQTLDFLVRACYEPYWFSRCEQISKAMFMGLSVKGIGASKLLVFRSGADILCSALTQSIECRTGTSIERLAEGVRGNVVVSGRNASGEFEDSYDAVVIATTANVATELIKTLSTGWVDDGQRKFLKSQEYIENVHAAYLIPTDTDKDPFITPCGPARMDVVAIKFYRWAAGHPNKTLASVYLSASASRRTANEVRRRCQRCLSQGRTRGVPAMVHRCGVSSYQ